MIRTPFFLALFFLVIVLITWTYTRTLKEIQLFDQNRPQPVNHALRSVANQTPQDLRPIKNHDIFKYEEPVVAGSGTYLEEFRRYNLFMSSQGVVCQNIRHFGGHYMNDQNPPEFDPDGAWYLCLDPDVLLTPSTCVVYSVGINDEWSFDESIARYGCRVYAFDPSMNKDDHFRTPRIQFFKLGLSDIDSEGTPGATGKTAWKTRTLKSIVKELGHEKRLIDVLKMDIEWDEWNCLPQMLADGTLKQYVKQLDVEFHVVDQTAYGIRRYYGISMWLDRQGFKIANMHKNMYCPQCYETTYINTNLIRLPFRDDVRL